MLRDLSLSMKLLLLVAVFLGSFGLFSFFTWRTVETVRVNGAIYRQIIQGKDLIADVLPPPAYIIESYLLARELLDETDPVRQSALVAKGAELRTQFETRQEHWKRTLPAGELADLMTSVAARPALEFFQIRDSVYVPALKAGDGAQARTALAQMARAYETHRGAVDQVVAITTGQNLRFETEAEDRVRTDRSTLLLLGSSLVIIVLALAWFAGREARRLGQRIGVAAQIAQQVAGGDLTAQVPVTDDEDETGQLLRAIGSMTQSLRALVARAKQTSIEMLTSATEFAAASRQQEMTVQGFGASTQQVASAARQISSTSSELSMTVEGINMVANQTAELAEEGRAGLKGLDDTMERLGKTAAAMSSRLAAIREEAAEITSVVTTISKVADQTNLLSINAAIEAEKAGEQGLGFLVLAREIRRLADQTAVATLDIEEMVKQMQTAVSAGVMEIDRFAEEVRSGIGSVERIGGRFGQIISQVKSLSERFDTVNSGMRSQSQGARQISDAMGQLTEGARQTNSALREFNAATESLRDSIGSLKQQIAQFNVGA